MLLPLWLWLADTLAEGENNVLYSQFGIVLPLTTWIRPDELDRGILCCCFFVCVFFSLQLFQLFQESDAILFCCRAPEMFCGLCQ